MTPKHTQFIEAIREKKKVCLRFKADTGVIDLICAPLDYGPGAGNPSRVDRYWLWDYTSNTGFPTLGLLPEQVLDMRVLGVVFDPAEFGLAPPEWSIPRDWGLVLGSGSENPACGTNSERKAVQFL